MEKQVLPEYQEILSVFRKLMKETAPNAKEIISYGIPAYKMNHIIAVINPTKKGITFAFSQAAKFEDKYGLLEGIGQVSKNVRINNVSSMNKEALRYYIKQAIEFDSK